MQPLVNRDQASQATLDLSTLDSATLDNNWNLPKYFGQIKVISLDTKAERFQRFRQEMEKIGMSHSEYDIVPGVDGSTLDHSIWSRMVDWDKQLSPEDKKLRYQGQAGCFMAHYNAIKEAVDAYKDAQKTLDDLKRDPHTVAETLDTVVGKVKRLSSVLIIEDNNGFGRVTGDDSADLAGVGRQFRLAMQSLPHEWDMFYFMSMWDAKKISDNLAKLDYGIITKCYAINARMYDRVIEALEVITTAGKEIKPVDHALASLHKSSNCYVSLPPLTYRFVSKSFVGGDLGNKDAVPKNWQSNVELK